METKFLPGPWENKGLEDDLSGGHRVFAADGRVVAYVPTVGMPDCEPEITAANGALIEAAPDLFGCCVAVLRVIDGNDLLRAKLKAAIRRATGT